MCTCEETSKSQLGEIKNAMSHISSLRAKTIYLRKSSQESHVKRMQLARSRGEPLSPVFVLPSSSPIREPKRTQIDSPPKPMSPNKTTIKEEEDKQVKGKTFHKCKVVNQKDEKVLRTCASDGCKSTLKEKDDKISAKHSKPNEIKKTRVKSTLSLGRYSKREKSKRNDSEKKSPKYKARKDKIQNKKSPKKASIFYKQSPPPVTTELGKGDGNACEADCDVISSPKQMSPNESEEPEKSAENPSDMAASNLSNSLNELHVGETRREDDQNNKTLNASEVCHSLKRPLKKKKKGIPRHKTNPVKSSQKEKKIREAKNIGLRSNANKTSIPIKFFGPNTVLSTAVKKNSSVLSRSMSLDSLEDRQKTLKASISPVPRTIDKVLNFINDKKDLITSTSLENGSQLVKMADNSEKPPMRLYGLARGSKIPFHEFRKYQTRSHGKATKIPEDPLHGKFRTKDKESNVYGCIENTNDISPLINPFKSEKSIVKSWLRTIPDAAQKNEKTGKKARELIPNSLNFITANSTVEIGKQMISENGPTNFSEIGKHISPSTKRFNYSPENKTPESEEPESAAISSTVTISLSSSALTESEIEEGKRFETLKNNFRPSSKSPNFKFPTHSRDFLMNPIEKFMNEINFAMNHSDSEDIITESSQASTSKYKKKSTL